MSIKFGILQQITGSNPIWDNLISYYKMEGDSTDSKGSIDLTATSITYPSAKHNLGGNFSVVGSRMTNGNNTDFDFDGSVPFSFSMWLKRNSIGVTGFIFTKSVVGGNWNGYGVYFTSNVVNYSLVNNVSNRIVKTTTASTDTTNYHHYIFTYDGSKNASGLKFYFDGSLQSATTKYNTLTGSVSNTSAFEIGNRPGNSLSALSVIDEFAIFDAELTSSDVTTLYNSGDGLYY